MRYSLLGALLGMILSYLWDEKKASFPGSGPVVGTDSKGVFGPGLDYGVADGAEGAAAGADRRASLCPWNPVFSDGPVCRRPLAHDLPVVQPGGRGDGKT